MKIKHTTLRFHMFINILYILLPIGFAFYIIYPLLNGNYQYPFAEYEVYKSYMVNFIETLKNWQLPIWNEYVGCGHPAIYFGHYPISQNTIIYRLFGFNNFIYYITRFSDIVILLLSFLYACKYLRFGYLITLIGALAYFSVNFVTRVIISETIGNLVVLYPLLVVFIVKIIDENRKRDILIFNLFYILWLSGGHILYAYMHIVMLSIIYWITVFIYKGLRISNLRYILQYFILFIIPILAVLYQYYFIYDVISTSNRLKEGLIISPFEPVVWRQFLDSFKSSSYFWIGLFFTIAYICFRLLSKRTVRLKITPFRLLLLLGILVYLTVVNLQFISNSNFIIDYIPILNSPVFRIALILYFVNYLILNRLRSISLIGLKELFVFIVYISILSYYFYSPENIIGDVNGYDYDLFRELSSFYQVLFTFCVLLSIKDYSNNKIVRIMVLGSIALYLIRSHLTIPLLRFTGIVWYAPRDGPIFSVFFAILFIFGLRGLLYNLSYIFKNRKGIVIRYILLLLFLVILMRDSYNKFYKGTSHRYVYPNRIELAKIPMEKWVIEGREEITLLNNKLLALDKEIDHFYRVFTPENNYLYLTGNLQQYKIYEASIYESSVSRELKDFYDYTILKKSPSRAKELKYVMPYFLFTRHVHAGLSLQYREIPYGGDIFLFDPRTDTELIKNQNIEFLWDIMQVRFLIIGPDFSKAIEGFTNQKDYKLLNKYPKLNLNLYEITKKKSYSRLAILPLGDKEDYYEAMEQINSKDIRILKNIYNKLIFLDRETSDFKLLNSKNYYNKRYYKIFARQKAILIDFESWNHNWTLKTSKKDRKLQKAFQLFKGIQIKPGINRIELIYHVKYFNGLFLLAILVILIHIFLLGQIIIHERFNKKVL